MEGAQGDYEWSRGTWILFIASATVVCEVVLAVGLGLGTVLRRLAYHLHGEGAARRQRTRRAS
jgi:hypothetical protein